MCGVAGGGRCGRWQVVWQVAVRGVCVCAAARWGMVCVVCGKMVAGGVWQVCVCVRVCGGGSSGVWGMRCGW